MRSQPEAVALGKDHLIDAKIGNTVECRRAISATIAKRAYEIYERQGRRRGRDQENWRLAEAEILQPLNCGILESKDEFIVSLFCSAVGTKDNRELEIVVEPHRLILVGKKQSGSESREDACVYRVLPLKQECDPSSVKLRRNGSLLEIAINKMGISKRANAIQRAA
jgi:Protein of unknown function (DUF2934)